MVPFKRIQHFYEEILLSGLQKCQSNFLKLPIYIITCEFVSWGKLFIIHDGFDIRNEINIIVIYDCERFSIYEVRLN